MVKVLNTSTKNTNGFKYYYDKLNPDQKQAVDCVDGPLLVLAGPGTGKTELLSVRAANIIHLKKVNPENILILTYTNAAAKTMKERLVKILGAQGYDIETATFHSFANSIILESEEAANYIQDKVEIEEMEQVKLLEYILDHTEGIDAIRPFRAPYFYREYIQNKISELKKDGITPKEFEGYVSILKPDNIYIEEKHIPRLKALALVYKLYEEYKSGKNKDLFDERGRYDFDDMIIFALGALREESQLKRTLQRQYTYIMVDEYQDTNGAQLNLLFELIDRKSANICCVGDDDQSIYRFQGASVGNFKIFKEAFPDSTVISLKDNYRSTQDIINVADKIIKQLPDYERMAVKRLIPRKDYCKKSIEFHEFTTEAEELLFIRDKVNSLKEIIENSVELSVEERKLPYNNIAVLVRKRDDILKITDAFLKAGIPYATDKETDISSEKRVRQMIDVLRLVSIKNTMDISFKDLCFYRVITSDYFGIPINDILKFIGYVKARRQAMRSKDIEFDITFFSEFMESFAIKDKTIPPTRDETAALKINKRLEFSNPHNIYRAAWVINRLFDDAETRPVHSILMQYINDTGVFKYILNSYNTDKILRIRELRALASFVNMVRESDLRLPGIRLADFMNEIETKEEHQMPLIGSLVTQAQEGVRIFTAHGSKGLEFHTVIIPFCLQNKNWPIRSRPDLIPIPPEIFKTRDRITDKALLKELNFYDETRLFYVASTRAKSNLIYTASPTESAISSAYLSNIGLQSIESELQTEEEILIKSLETTDKKDSFINTEVILKDLVSDLTLNPTSLNNYINCKRKFLYDNVLMLPSEKKLSLTFGNCVHKALEDTYHFFLEKGIFCDFDFFVKAFQKELFFQGVEDSIRLACLRQIATLKVWFEQEAKNPIRPLGLEKKLSVMLDDGLIFTGKYDKTELVDEKARLVRVVDYKTGLPDKHIKDMESASKDLGSDECEDYLRQLVAYKLLFDRDKTQNKGYRVSSGTLVFIEPVKEDALRRYGIKKGEFVKKTVEITDDMVEELEAVIKRCRHSIKSLDFEKLAEMVEDMEKCGGCDYRNICWD